jgi:hypothetical protein
MGVRRGVVSQVFEMGRDLPALHHELARSGCANYDIACLETVKIETFRIANAIAATQMRKVSR